MGLPISDVSSAANRDLSARSTPATERMRDARSPTPASRHPWRASQALARALSIALSSASGNVASSRPVAGSMDFSTRSNHGTIGFVARARSTRRAGERSSAVAATVRYRHESTSEWTEVAMRPLANDRWAGEFPVTQLGRYMFTVDAWVDPFETWRRRLAKRAEAGQDLKVEREVGGRLLDAAAARAGGAQANGGGDAARLIALSKALRAGKLAQAGGEIVDLMRRNAPREATTSGRELEVLVERVGARSSAWYELFPRSHGGLAGVARLMPEIAAMGFDVVYLPPIHPIGQTHRKGANNQPARAGEPGSPWAIGSAAGGHKAIDPQLGTMEDFRRLVALARQHDIDIALDIALQCSPDHPYVREHPEWFKHRPDGSIQHAENPPKRYEDIYPFDFENDHWPELWEELLSIVVFWADEGVRVFRVDNPHTKPFAFWEWLIAEAQI